MGNEEKKNESEYFSDYKFTPKEGDTVLDYNSDNIKSVSSDVVVRSYMDSLIGRQLGDCKMDEILGKGGMGAVFKAHHRSLDIEVAVKIIDNNLVMRDPTFVERFYREARQAAKLNHPNIMRVYNVGEDQRIHYLIIEFVDGPSLQDFLKVQGKLEPEHCASLMIQALDGLNHAHQKGILHRDIKPDNLMVNSEGTLKITDFGLAKPKEPQQGVDITGAGNKILGTPAFMPLEQWQQGEIDSPELDERADLYALGVTMFMMLTGGMYPFYAETVLGIFQKMLSGKRLSFRSAFLKAWDENAFTQAMGTKDSTKRESIWGQFSSRFKNLDEIVRIVEKMCAVSREKRYESAEAAKTDLEDYLKDSKSKDTRPDIRRMSQMITQTQLERRQLMGAAKIYAKKFDDSLLDNAIEESIVYFMELFEEIKDDDHPEIIIRKQRLRQKYTSEIEQALINESLDHAEGLLSSYIQVFGEDDEIKSFKRVIKREKTKSDTLKRKTDSLKKDATRYPTPPGLTKVVRPTNVASFIARNVRDIEDQSKRKDNSLESILRSNETSSAKGISTPPPLSKDQGMTLSKKTDTLAELTTSQAPDTSDVDIESISAMASDVISREMVIETDEHIVTEVNQKRERMFAQKPDIDALDISVIFKPSLNIGGDFVKFLPLRKEAFGMCFGTVSESGMDAYSKVEEIISKLDGCKSDIKSASYVAKKLNSEVSRRYTLTMSSLILDLESYELRFSRAGATPLLLFNPERGEDAFVHTPRGTLIGMEDSARFDSGIEEEEIQLYSGDTIILFSKSLIDITNQAGEKFSERRLEESVAKHATDNASHLGSAILDEVLSFRNTDLRLDDMSCIVVRIC